MRFLNPVQRIHNLTLPRWVTRDVLDTLNKIASFEVMYSILSHKRKEKARLSGGERSHFTANHVLGILYVVTLSLIYD